MIDGHPEITAPHATAVRIALLPATVPQIIACAWPVGSTGPDRVVRYEAFWQE